MEDRILPGPLQAEPVWLPSQLDLAAMSFRDTIA